MRKMNGWSRCFIYIKMLEAFPVTIAFGGNTSDSWAPTTMCAKGPVLSLHLHSQWSHEEMLPKSAALWFGSGHHRLLMHFVERKYLQAVKFSELKSKSDNNSQLTHHPAQSPSHSSNPWKITTNYSGSFSYDIQCPRQRQMMKWGFPSSHVWPYSKPPYFTWRGRDWMLEMEGFQRDSDLSW